MKKKLSALTAAIMLFGAGVWASPGRSRVTTYESGGSVRVARIESPEGSHVCVIHATGNLWCERTSPIGAQGE